MTDLPLRHSLRTITEPDGFADVATGITLDVAFRRRQQRSSRVEQFQTPRWALDFGEANVNTRVSGILLGGWASICLNLGPADSTWNGHAGDPGSVSLLPPGEELIGHTAPGFSWVTMAIPPDLWQRCLLLTRSEDNPLRRLVVCQLPTAQRRQIEGRLRTTSQVLRSLQQPLCSPLASYDAADLVEECFATVCELASQVARPKDSLRNRARLVRNAEAWMRDHLAEPVQVPDVCLALRVSRRELEYAFRTMLDQSPRDYLHNLRLTAIRRALQRGDARLHGIIDVAFAHGVTHLSRFAASYRTLFGEKPSETLRR